jgi:glutathione synthase
VDLLAKMKFAFQMDPLEELNLDSDSTWLLMQEAKNRGAVYYYTPKDLFWQNNALFANAQKFNDIGNVETIDLTDMDIIFIRQDPPYDMAYLTTTYLLEKIADKVLFVNSPRAIRNFPEKVSCLDYPDLIPPTLITYDIKEASRFINHYNKVVIKPLYSFAGNDVSLVSKRDDIQLVINKMIETYKAPVILQNFIPQVIEGDKRIILIDGEPIGCFLRKPAKGEIRANLARGGTAIMSNPNERDLEICNKLKPMLKQNGLIFTGIDIIDNYLIEINITSPTGLITLKNNSFPNIAQLILDKIVEKL